MTGIVKTDQLQGAQGTTVTVPTGNTLAVTSNATVGGTLGVTGVTTMTSITVGDGHTIGNQSVSDNLEIKSSSGENIVYNSENGAHIFYKDGIENFRVNDDGEVRVTDNIRFTASSKGIYLGVTSATASNLLDDYEEGTFTPTVYDSGGNTMSLSTSQGYYTKIGRTVHFNFYIVLASSGNTFAGNQVYIGGLPFTASSATNNVNMQQMVRSNVDSTSGYSEVISYIAPNSNYSQLLHGGDNIGFDNFRGTALNNSCQFQQVGHYFVA